MGEVATMADYSGDGFDERVLEWEAGLPGADDLTPLSQALIPRNLANAFNIRPETSRSRLDVDRASRETFSGLRRDNPPPPVFAQNSFKPYFDEANNSRDLVMIDEEEEEEEEEGDRSDYSRKIRRVEEGEYSNSVEDLAARALKRPRLVWTPQLHKRFVDVVKHLGIKSAVPKTIMQLMNVEGLTRENVASHLQKYRLYMKRNQGVGYDGGSNSDQLFSSAPAPYGQGVVPLQMFGNGHGHHHLYGVVQQRDWSGNSNGSVVSYPHAVGNTDK